MKKAKANTRGKIKEMAKLAMIDPSEEFYLRVEEELEKQITVEFLEKIRTELIKKSKSQGTDASASASSSKS